MAQNIVVVCSYVNRIKYLFNKTCELLHNYKGFKCHKGSAQIFVGELRIRFMLAGAVGERTRGERNIQFFHCTEWEEMLERNGE